MVIGITILFCGIRKLRLHVRRRPACTEGGRRHPSEAVRQGVEPLAACPKPKPRKIILLVYERLLNRKPATPPERILLLHALA